MILVLPFADDTKQTIYKYIAWVFGFGALRLGEETAKSMEGMGVYMDGKPVGKIVAQTVDEELGRISRRKT